MGKARIGNVLQDLLFAPGLDLAAVVDRYFAPDYRQRTNGVWADRVEVVEHFAHLRSIVADGGVEVHEELMQGSSYAERHTVTITKTDGVCVTTEVYVFGEHGLDGRFARIEEITLMLVGEESDRNLGNAR